MNESLAPDRLRDDLAFVRRAVERSEAWCWPLPIAGLWAAIVVVGFTLIDLEPRAAPAYWGAAAPLGFLASLWLGRRSAHRHGEVDRATATRIALHWLSPLLGFGLAVPAVLAGAMSWRTLGLVMILVAAIVYYLAGLHGTRRLLWVALALAVGYLAVLWLPAGAWTATGVLFAGALLASAGLRRRSGDDRG